MSKNTKYVVGFVIIFGLIAVAFTYLCIEKAEETLGNIHLPIGQTTAGSDVEDEVTAPDTELSEMPIDIYGTYDQNDVIINTVIDKKGDAEVKYPEIDGLKDKSVEQKINVQLRNNMDELISEYEALEYANFYVRANFANVLSISLHSGGDERYEQRYLNYELVTGEKLELEDLFMKDADVLSVVRDAFYKASASQNWYTGEGQLISPDENEVYKLVKSYMDDGDKVFNFTPAEILFYENEHVAAAKMTDHYKIISVYSKYLTEESIYENDDIGYENIFTCAECNYESFDIIDYGYGEDNMWYDMTVWKGYVSDAEREGLQIEKIDVVNDSIHKEIYDFIEGYKERARANKDKFYIVFAKPGYYILSLSEYVNGEWRYTYSDAMETSLNIQVFEMPVELYESIYRDEIIDTYRYPYFVMRGGSYLDTDNLPEGVSVEIIAGTRLYNYKTGCQIEELDDVFKEGYDYMGYIRERAIEYYINQGYSFEDSENLFETAEIALAGGSVAVDAGISDYPYTLGISEFDATQLEIFSQEG